MEKEISSGAMLGIVLIALAAIIGLGFGVFAIAKGTANEGVVGVQENLGAVADASFTDYDQKIVTGTQVVSAYNNFEGKTVAILIGTRSFVSGDAPNNSAVEYEDTTANDYTVQAFEVDGTTTIKMLDNANQNEDIEFINYNALLATDAKVNSDNGKYVTSAAFNAPGGVVKFNGITGGLSKSGNSEYIPSSGRFQANLLKDSSGTIMGVVFQQIGS